MRRLPLILVLLVFAGLPLVQPRPQKLSLPPLILANVTVIDLTASPQTSPVNVTIHNGRIQSIRPAAALPATGDARVIDASGKFLIPGLWDMHLHILRETRARKAFAQLLANGVLGLRDMGSPLTEPDPREWRRRVESGELPALRLAAAGALLDGAAPMFADLSLSAKDAAEAQQAVNFLHQSGADFIKVYSLLSRDAYFAAAAEARNLHLPFAGHVPDSVSAAEASDAGQRSIEHLSGVLLACSDKEEELRQQLLQARAADDAGLLYDALRNVRAVGGASFNEAKAASLFARFARNQTWQTPTLVAIWNGQTAAANANRHAATGKRLAATASAASRRGAACCLDADLFTPFASEEAERVPEVMRMMKEAGVRFLAGTDTPNLWGAPGSSLHKELALFVAAGFTPMEALETATRNPAEFFGMLDVLGTIEEGKFADLVLLDANPLAEIANTARVAAVILRGEWLTKADLLDLLQDSEMRK